MIELSSAKSTPRTAAFPLLSGSDVGILRLKFLRCFEDHRPLDDVNGIMSYGLTGD